MTSKERPYCDGPVLVIGAGPAGLTAAYELARRGVKVVVLEKEEFPGGIARTAEYRGYRFDIGGHRFFTKYRWVNDLWHELLGEDLLVRPRRSRIFCRGTFFDYPLTPANVLSSLGIRESFRILGSYLKARIAPVAPEVTLADWVTNRFGKRLFELFFKSYTEKVWGVSCAEIGAKWAAQRIKGLSLRTAVANMFRRHGVVDQGEPIRTLIGSFFYPRLGPGMMWQALCRKIVRHGGSVFFGVKVEKVLLDGDEVCGVVVDLAGERELIPAGHLISTMPLRHLVERLAEVDEGAVGEAKVLPRETLRSGAPARVLKAARGLRYRDFLTVALIVNRAELFSDNWIYIHEESLRVGRIQNFGNWSPELVPEPGKSCLGLEYFCFKGDELWSMSDAELVALATRELEATGLVQPGMVEDGVVVRVPKAYPMYDEGYAERVGVIRDHLAGIGNLQVIGRNGMHKYNNMDHSMLTGLLAARNIFGEGHDLWGVNEDEEYLEQNNEQSTMNNERKPGGYGELKLHPLGHLSPN